MLSLTEKLPRAVEYRGRRFALRTEYYRVLQCFALLQEDALPEEQVAECLRLLVKGRLRLRFLPLDDRAGLLRAVLEQYVVPQKRKKQPKSLDFTHDAGYIYSSFLLAYGIDLTESRMHWWKFLELLSGLPEETKLSQILSIRQRPMPKPTKYNGEERARLARLKSEYAVYKTERERQQDLQEGWRHLAMTLDAMSKRGGGK